MELGDEIKRVLDQGGAVVLFQNQLGSYTAAVIDGSVEAIRTTTITDDFEPTKALKRLSDKVFKTGEYSDGRNEGLSDER